MASERGLAGDNLIIPGGQPPDCQGLNDPMDTDGIRQIRETVLVKAFPGLLDPGLHL